MTELPIEGLLLETLSVLERLEIPYAIMGGFAVRAWAIPRPTYDADVAIAVDDRTLAKLLLALADQGFTVPEEHKAGFVDTVGGLSKVKVTRFVARSVWDIDFFSLDTRCWNRRLRESERCCSLGETSGVLAPEDVILLKLIAFRRKDQFDIEEILMVTRNFDASYLWSWADRLGVDHRLVTFIDR